MLNFTSENKIIWVLGKIGQYVLLNFLVLLCSIPIFTLGASVTAAMHLLRRMKEPEGNILSLEFFRYFKEDFSQATKATLPLIIAIIVGAGDVYYGTQVAENVDPLFTLLGCLILFIAISMFIWTTILVAHFENTTEEHLKNALLLTFARLPRTLVVWIIWGVPIVLAVASSTLVVILAFCAVTFLLGVLLQLSYLVLKGVMVTE